MWPPCRRSSRGPASPSFPIRSARRLPRMSSFDAGELGAGLQAVAGQLSEMSERLRQSFDQVRAREFRASDRDGLAEVTVDGRPRVTGLRLHPDALRAGPDEID